MDLLPLAWRPGLVGAALVLVVCAVARPASVRRTIRRAVLLATRAGVFGGELLLLVEHRITRRRRVRRRPPLRWMARLSALADQRLVRAGAARRERVGPVPPVRTAVLVTLAVATFAPSAAWVATDRWPQNPFARATRSAFSRWDGIEGRLRPGGDADVAADQVAGPSSSAVARPRLAWSLPGVDEPIRFGDPADRVLAADLDGDGASELVAFVDGTWRIAGWADELALGQPGDVPVPADYDGDRKANPAVFRPATGEWLVDGAAAPIVLGAPDDVPVPAAYTTAGVAQPAVYRPSTGEWWVLRGVAEPVPWGAAGDVPVPAPWFGADRTVPAVYRPSTGELWVIGHDPVDVGVTGGEPVALYRDGALTVAVVGAPA